MYAVVKTGGKQYKVAESDVIRVEKLDLEPGATVDLTEVLMVADGSKVKIGTPVVAGAKVTATVLAQVKAKKIHGFTYTKERTQTHYGHRQKLTSIRIDKIQA